MTNEHSEIVPSMQPTSTVADFKFWCQKVLPLVYDDSLSYYEVLNKMVVYLNQVIDNINANIDNIDELKDDFLLLQTYVNNFFDDIDQLVTYTERAEAAETAALSSAASAAESATNSASSAVNAATSSGSAATSALSAMDAKDAAVVAKTAAETALANAQTAATNAAASATAAGNSATAAGNSATAASGSATNAAASAASAQQSFTLADAARVAAQSAETNAATSANAAAQSAASSDGAYAQAMIAAEEETTALSSHNIGDYFRINGVLYIATANIQVGDTISTSTNCLQVVLGNEVSGLKTAINENSIFTISYTIDSAGGFARWENGVIASPTSTTYKHTDYIDISAYGHISFKNVYSATSNSQVGMAFYDANKTYICGMQCHHDSNTAGYKVCYFNVPYNAVYARFSVYIDTTTYGDFELKGISRLFANLGGQWFNKTWYAYGTSVTSLGRYTIPLADFAGMQLTNMGIAGAGLVEDGLLKDAVMNITDGKLNADIITLEVGANDRNSPLGDVQDTGDTTICGALNQCIRYLQENTTAQIVVMSTTVPQTLSNGTTQTPPNYEFAGGYTSYELNTAIANVCKVNGVFYIPLSEGLGFGYSRIISGVYLNDNIHPTFAGGYNLANGVWNYLKNIPVWNYCKMSFAT